MNQCVSWLSLLTFLLTPKLQALSLSHPLGPYNCPPPPPPPLLRGLGLYYWVEKPNCFSFVLRDSILSVGLQPPKPQLAAQSACLEECEGLLMVTPSLTVLRARSHAALTHHLFLFFFSISNTNMQTNKHKCVDTVPQRPAGSWVVSKPWLLLPSELWAAAIERGHSDSGTPHIPL